MTSNLDRYKKDIERLIVQGNRLLINLKLESDPIFSNQVFKGTPEDKKKEKIDSLPKFTNEYQPWYSEVKALIRQVIPDRLDDFVRYYEKPKFRKDINFENYRIEDALQGLVICRGQGEDAETILDDRAAIPHLKQQIAILEAASARFESSLFDIKKMLQADILDSELDAARELLKNGFIRAAGIIAGVVLERHLAEICKKRSLSAKNKTPGINDFNEILKANSIVDIPTWRQIQRLGDLRNLCGHPKDREPTKEEAEELISGAEKFTHTLY